MYLSKDGAVGEERKLGAWCDKPRSQLASFAIFIASAGKYRFAFVTSRHDYVFEGWLSEVNAVSSKHQHEWRFSKVAAVGWFVLLTLSALRGTAWLLGCGALFDWFQCCSLLSCNTKVGWRTACDDNPLSSLLGGFHKKREKAVP